MHRNPALWTGEAIFSVIALVTRPFAPLDVRLDAAIARMRAIPAFLASARRVMLAAPALWRARALRECSAAVPLFRDSLPRWWSANGAPARTVATQPTKRPWRPAPPLNPSVIGSSESCPRRRHRRRSVGSDLLACSSGEDIGVDTPSTPCCTRRARRSTQKRRSSRARRTRHGGWANVQEQLANAHPSREEYLPRFARIWESCRDLAVANELVTWPDAPIRYVPIPEHTRDAAPHLYYLFYRSPAPFDRLPVHDYVVTPIGDDLPPDEQRRRLRAANDSVIKLNHVVHHGALGHHVQNAFAYRASVRIGQIAAVDGASRIGMFSGGTLAEGWACYACDLMEEAGFLTPLESVAQQHTRVRLAGPRGRRSGVAQRPPHARGDRGASIDERASMPPEAAQSEAVKNSMFPGTALMYWLGTRGLHELRRASEAREGSAFRLGRFHDRVLALRRDPGAAHRAVDDARLLLTVACAVLSVQRHALPRSPRHDARRTICSSSATTASPIR